MRFRRWNDNGMYEVNMTPLIDVSLVLVVMLLLATPLAFESSIGVRQSAEAAKKAEQIRQDEQIELYVVSEELVQVNRPLIDREKMSAVLKPLLDASVNKSVMVACEDGVSHGAFVYVLDHAKMCGARQIGVMGGNQ